VAGLVADAFGLSVALGTIAALTFASGVVAAIRMTETLQQRPARPEGTNGRQPQRGDI
jgi:hypothetical protein